MLSGEFHRTSPGEGSGPRARVSSDLTVLEYPASNGSSGSRPDRSSKSQSSMGGHSSRALRPGGCASLTLIAAVTDYAHRHNLLSHLWRLGRGGHRTGPGAGGSRTRRTLHQLCAADSNEPQRPAHLLSRG